MHPEAVLAVVLDPVHRLIGPFQRQPEAIVGIAPEADADAQADAAEATADLEGMREALQPATGNMFDTRQ